MVTSRRDPVGCAYILQRILALYWTSMRVYGLHVFWVSVDTTAMIVQRDAFPISGISGADIVIRFVLDVVH